MEFGKQLKLLRLRNGYTQKELGAKIGVSEVTIGNWERGVKTPNLGAILSLGEALHVSLDVLTNFAPTSVIQAQVVADPKERTLLEQYRRLDKYGKQAVDMICNIEFARVSKQTVAGHTKERGKLVTFQDYRERTRYIPVYVNPSAAGVAVPLEGDDFEMMLADTSVPRDADFGVKIQGDSMSPYIEDGSMVFVNRDAEIRNGDVGIFSVDGTMYCKQFFRDSEGNVHLLSANPDRMGSNIFLSADCDSTFMASGKVLLGRSIPLPDYFDI